MSNFSQLIKYFNLMVVFSRSYLAKKRRTKYELNGLFAKEKDKNIVLPVWYKITREDILFYSP